MGSGKLNLKGLFGRLRNVQAQSQEGPKPGESTAALIVTEDGSLIILCNACAERCRLVIDNSAAAMGVAKSIVDRIHVAKGQQCR